MGMETGPERAGLMRRATGLLDGERECGGPAFAAGRFRARVFGRAGRVAMAAAGTVHAGGAIGFAGASAGEGRNGEEADEQSADHRRVRLKRLPLWSRHLPDLEGWSQNKSSVSFGSDLLA